MAYLPVLDKNITDPRVYSGKGYFIDHAINHHPEVPIGEYVNIQAIIDGADDVKLDDKNPNRNKSLLFIKAISPAGVVVVSFDEGKDGKIVLHKSFFTKTKKGRFDKMPSVKLSSVDGNSTISRAEAPAGRLSALEDANIIPQTGSESQEGKSRFSISAIRYNK